ncbi:Spy/CpxP family protein refolding chaperone [Cribrihabitans sp. XS_ASV171]
MFAATARAATALVLICGAVQAGEQSVDQPYAGQQEREIASLSEADVAALLDGQGWGLAKPAELNGYPGPAHVLELGEALDLSEAQRAAIEEIRATMQAEARVLGADYVEAERHLGMMFRMGHAAPEMVDRQLAASGDLLARLRGVHLKAHVATRPVLTESQLAEYQRLRGYDEAGHGGHGGHGGHSHD